MRTKYQARWISKARMAEVKRHRDLHNAILLDTFNRAIIVEPVGADLGDGEIFSQTEADYELQPVWCVGPITKLKEARRRLGLEREELAAA